MPRHAQPPRSVGMNASSTMRPMSWVRAWACSASSGAGGWCVLGASARLSYAALTRFGLAAVLSVSWRLVPTRRSTRRSFPSERGASWPHGAIAVLPCSPRHGEGAPPSQACVVWRAPCIPHLRSYARAGGAAGARSCGAASTSASAPHGRSKSTAAWAAWARLHSSLSTRLPQYRNGRTALCVARIVATSARRVGSRLTYSSAHSSAGAAGRRCVGGQGQRAIRPSARSVVRPLPLRQAPPRQCLHSHSPCIGALPAAHLRLPPQPPLSAAVWPKPRRCSVQ